MFDNIKDKIDSEYHENLRAALIALAEAGVGEDDLSRERIQDLCLTIVKKAERYTGVAYNALHSLAIAKAVTVDNIDQVKELIVTISERAGGFAADTYVALSDLCKAVTNETADRAVMDIRLLTTIAKKACQCTHNAYGALRNLAIAVTNGSADRSVLNINLLTVIAENREDAYSAYSALRALATANAVTSNNIDQVKDLFIAIPVVAGTNALVAYIALGALATANAVTPNNIDQVKELFIDIPRNSKAYADFTPFYNALCNLATAKAVTADNIVQVKDLLKCLIDQGNPEWNFEALKTAVRSGVINAKAIADKQTLNKDVEIILLITTR